MTYSVGNSTVANYANTSSGKVTNVVADNGVGGSGESVNVVDRAQISFVVDTNIINLTVNVSSLSGYIAGKSDITVTVNSNVYVYGIQPKQSYPGTTNYSPPNGPTTPIASMEIVGGVTGDTIKLVNNGYIVGYGGNGGGIYYAESDCVSGYNLNSSPPTQGNAALSLITPGISLTIQNNGYIAGGGGGGAGGGTIYSGLIGNRFGVNGGGGAGGGIGVTNQYYGYIYNMSGVGQIPAVPPSSGINGTIFRTPGDEAFAYTGGNGGFAFPGTGGVLGSDIGVGIGGGSGGSGAAYDTISGLPWNNNGGSGTNNAGTTSSGNGTSIIGGGGGGWGASGGNGYEQGNLTYVGATGGNSIVTNGNAYTMLGDGATRLYGTVSTATTANVYTFTTSSYSGRTINLTDDIPGRTTGGDNLVLIIPANVTIASNSFDVTALTIETGGGSTFFPASVRFIINGAILGGGGCGGSLSINRVGSDALKIPGDTTGTPYPWIIDNTYGYIAGGGGGGGRGQNAASATKYVFGGGGAGFGASSGYQSDVTYTPGIEDGIFANGDDGTVVINGANTYASAGSGGTIIPATRTYYTGTFSTGTYPGKGGNGGGAGAFTITTAITNPGNYGGGNNEQGGSQTGGTNNGFGGGGGGWGSAGGTGRRATSVVQTGKAGGNSIRFASLSYAYIFISNQNHIAGAIGV